jgi:amino acid permease
VKLLTGANGKGGIFREIAEMTGKKVPDWIFNKWFLVFAPAIIIVFPFLFLRKIDGFSFLGTVGTALIGLYLIHSIVYLGIGVHQNGFDPQHELKWFSFNTYVIQALSIQAFAFHCQPIVGPTVKRLENPTRKRQYILLGLVIFAAAIAYFIGGLLPYLTLFDRVQDPVIFNWYPSGQVFTVVTKTMYCLFLIITNPPLFFTARNTFITMTFKREVGFWIYNGIGLALLLLSCIIAVTVDSVGVMFDFIGGVACTAIIYILPAIFYLRICKGESKVKTVISWIMIPVGSGSLIACLYSAINGLVNG